MFKRNYIERICILCTQRKGKYIYINNKTYTRLNFLLFEYFLITTTEYSNILLILVCMRHHNKPVTYRLSDLHSILL